MWIGISYSRITRAVAVGDEMCVSAPPVYLRATSTFLFAASHRRSSSDRTERSASNPLVSSTPKRPCRAASIAHQSLKWPLSARLYAVCSIFARLSVLNMFVVMIRPPRSYAPIIGVKGCFCEPTATDQEARRLHDAVNLPAGVRMDT
jgi:hypothetical protein